jgi:hypothetical protein
MSIKFKDVAHHFIGCQVKDNYNDKIGTFTGILDNGKAIQVKHNTDWELSTFEVMPILKPLEEMTDEVFDRDYAKFEQMEKDCLNKQDAVKCIAAMFSQMCKDGFDVFGLIDENEAVSTK